MRLIPEKTEKIREVLFDNKIIALSALEQGLRMKPYIPRGKNEEVHFRMRRRRNTYGHTVIMEVTQRYPDVD